MVIVKTKTQEIVLSGNIYSLGVTTSVANPCWRKVVSTLYI